STVHKGGDVGIFLGVDEHQTFDTRSLHVSSPCFRDHRVGCGLVRFFTIIRLCDAFGGRACPWGHLGVGVLAVAYPDVVEVEHPFADGGLSVHPVALVYAYLPCWWRSAVHVPALEVEQLFVVQPELGDPVGAVGVYHVDDEAVPSSLLYRSQV